MGKQYVKVDADALRALLVALNGPGHNIREIQATRSPLLKHSNPIDILIGDYNDAIAVAKAQAEAEKVTDVVDKVEYPRGEVEVIGAAGMTSCLLNRPLLVGTRLFGEPTFSELVYNAADGTLMNKDGTRSVFDDVDA